MSLLSFLFDNPLIVAGFLALGAVLVYLSTENLYMKHKTQELKRSIMRGWGLFLLILAFLSLFTTSFHVILDNVGMMENTATGYVTLEQANGFCTGGEFQVCDIINYSYWSSIAVIAIGIILIVIGSIKIKKKIEKAKKAEKTKKKGK